MFSLLWRVTATMLVVGLCVASAYFAYGFGFSMAVDPASSWALAYAGTCCAIDLLKSSCPFFAASAEDRGRRIAAWAIFGVATVMSIWAAFGNLAGQDAERLANKTKAASDLQQKQDALRDLQDRRSKVPDVPPTTAAAAEAAETALASAKEQARLECGDGKDRRQRGPKCGTREEDERKAADTLRKTQADRDATDSAKDLDEKIDAARDELEKADTKTAVREADPQAATLARATGWDPDKIETFRHGLLAVGLELVAGLGFWVLWRHGPSKRHEPGAGEGAREDILEVPAPSLPDSALEVRARFFRECVRVDKAGEVWGRDMYRAYAIFAEREGEQPMSQNAFGIDSPWQGLKHRTSRGIVYRSCALIPGLLPEAVRAPAAEPARPAGKPPLRLVATSPAPAIAG